ncbi:MAG: exodeoxyribonuclease III, partial [Nitrospirales bacterium]
MILATWNVNSIRSRLPHVVDWLKSANPDILLLQELKATDEVFPRSELEDLGFNVAIVGQKTYNGVGILSKHPIELEQEALPGDPSDDQARYIEAIIGTVRVASLYLPNGNPVDTDKFSYKLRWMERLTAHARALLDYEETLVLGGDFNICPTDDDVYDP